MPVDIKENNTIANMADMPATDGQAVPPADLNIADLRNAIHVIDVAVHRRAFGGWEELNSVKTVRDRIYSFVSTVAPDEIKRLEESYKNVSNNTDTMDKSEPKKYENEKVVANKTTKKRGK